jgi:hypothetical protein
MPREAILPEASYLRDIAARLRSQAQCASPAALREQLFELAEYYDGMAALTQVPPPAAPPSA